MEAGTQLVHDQCQVQVALGELRHQVDGHLEGKEELIQPGEQDPVLHGHVVAGGTTGLKLGY